MWWPRWPNGSPRSAHLLAKTPWDAGGAWEVAETLGADRLMESEGGGLLACELSSRGQTKAWMVRGGGQSGPA